MSMIDIPKGAGHEKAISRSVAIKKFGVLTILCGDLFIRLASSPHLSQTSPLTRHQFRDGQRDRNGKQQGPKLPGDINGRAARIE